MSPSELAIVSDEMLNGMVDAIVKEVDPESIILFGSRSRGEARPESDVDLIVIEREPFGQGRSQIDEMRRLWKVLSSYCVAKDILVYSLEDVEYWRDSINNVLARALREGRVLYERP